MTCYQFTKINQKTFCIFILTNGEHSVFYTGISNDLQRHMADLRAGHNTLARKYKLTKLVYFEFVENMKTALARVKQIRASSRPKKIELITAKNPTWVDLFDGLSS